MKQFHQTAFAGISSNTRLLLDNILNLSSVYGWRIRRPSSARVIFQYILIIVTACKCRICRSCSCSSPSTTTTASSMTSCPLLWTDSVPAYSKTFSEQLIAEYFPWSIPEVVADATI